MTELNTLLRTRGLQNVNGCQERTLLSSKSGTWEAHNASLLECLVHDISSEMLPAKVLVRRQPYDLK